MLIINKYCTILKNSINWADALFQVDTREVPEGVCITIL